MTQQASIRLRLGITTLEIGLCGCNATLIAVPDGKVDGHRQTDLRRVGGSTGEGSDGDIGAARRFFTPNLSQSLCTECALSL